MFGIHFLQIASGVVSTLIFAASRLPMLSRAIVTKDLKSYSIGNLVLCNLGNLIYWLYVLSLPFGPAWILHAFITATTGLMLIFYLRYEKGWTWFSMRAQQEVISSIARPLLTSGK